jgi:hypothetical protein
MPKVYINNRMCNVDSCNEEAEYINPDSKMKYCLNHAKMIGFKINYSSTKYIDLIKISKVDAIPRMEKKLRELKAKV